MPSNNITNYLTIDVEDYYHVSAFEDVIKFEDWGKHESRVVNNTRKILEILSRSGKTKGTFFVLGWVAERYPEIVKEIDAEGHEVACHSYLHKRIYNMKPDEFRDDALKGKNILEDIIGKEVIGFRAPTYSITQKSLWALDILEELGFRYDSSIFPILHDNYGIPNTARFKYKVEGHNITEYPISTSLILGQNIPISGGGYFRFFPYLFTKFALNRINKIENQPFVFYIHPWELDPEQPKVNGASSLSRIRHYVNLRKTDQRFHSLLRDFNFRPISIDFNGSAC